MKEIIHNDDNLKEEYVTELVVRAKALMLNNGNILLANENDILQFPGGHVEENEDVISCLKREILEETGIEIDDSEIHECILKVVFMNRNWPCVGKNRKCEIYYYVVKSNKLPDLTKINLTKDEKAQNFKVYFVPLDESIEYIVNNIPKNEMNNSISPDMIEVIKEYMKQNN